jgi:hypothetical protein
MTTMFGFFFVCCAIVGFLSIGLTRWISIRWSIFAEDGDAIGRRHETPALACRRPGHEVANGPSGGAVVCRNRGLAWLFSFHEKVDMALERQ